MSEERSMQCDGCIRLQDVVHWFADDTGEEFPQEMFHDECYTCIRNKPVSKSGEDGWADNYNSAHLEISLNQKALYRE